MFIPGSYTILITTFLHRYEYMQELISSRRLRRSVQLSILAWNSDGLTAATKICPYLEPGYVRRYSVAVATAILPNYGVREQD